MSWTLFIQIMLLDIATITAIGAAIMEIMKITRA